MKTTNVHREQVPTAVRYLHRSYESAEARVKHPRTNVNTIRVDPQVIRPIFHESPGQPALPTVLPGTCPPSRSDKVDAVEALQLYRIRGVSGVNRSSAVATLRPREGFRTIKLSV